MGYASRVFDMLQELGPDEVFVRWSPKSASVYFEAEYHDTVSSTNLLKVRISDHAHPQGFDGLDLCAEDGEANLLALREKIDSIFPPLASRR